MRQVVLFALAIFCLGGCCASWRCHCGASYERSKETVDSVGYRPQELDVPIPEESAADTVAVGDTTTVQTSIAEAKAWVEGGKVHQQIRNRSDQLLKIKLDVPVYFHSDKEVITRTVTQQTEKPMGWFKKTLMYAGIAALAGGVLALIGVAIHYRNKIKQLFNHI